jgi:parallel beta-helix repeat protein
MVGNTLFKNDDGMFLFASSSGNIIYHNNFVNNNDQAGDSSTGNQWDNGYPTGGNYWSDFDEASEGAYDDYQGTDQDISGNDGIIDNGTIGGGGRNPYVVSTGKYDYYPLIQPYGNYSFLFEGWNLISVPLIQLDTELGSVLHPIDDSYDSVQWYNGIDYSDCWKHNHTYKPHHLNDLKDINHTMGFWIHITEPGGVLFEYPGTQPTYNQSISLHPGWNMVGYPSYSIESRDMALNNIIFGTHIDAIWTYIASTQEWKEIGVVDSFEKGRGYWIHATQECVWEVPL